MIEQCRYKKRGDDIGLIIDSHAHYSHIKFENSFTYLDYKNGGYVTDESKDIFVCNRRAG